MYIPSGSSIYVGHEVQVIANHLPERIPIRA